jgi:hypothetical protein
MSSSLGFEGRWEGGNTEKKIAYGHKFNYLGSKERRRLKIIK